LGRLSSRTRRLWEYALFRWESATLIAGTLVASALAWQFRQLPQIPEQGWLAILAFGLVGEALLLYSSLRDPASLLRVGTADDALLPSHPKLRSPSLQRQVDQALDYYQRMLQASAKQQPSTLKLQLQDTLGQVRDWLRTIYRLAERLDLWQQERETLARDRQQAERRRRELERRQAAEDNPAVRAQLTENLDALEDQLRAGEALEDTMAQAQLRLEHTLSALSTLYSQSLLIDFKDASGSRVSELSHEIRNEKAVLDAIIGSMDQVYQAPGQQAS
jgi:hypothetical protein